MLYYQEITLINQAEISSYFIWSKIYTQLHLAFVEVKDQTDNINHGVSFPEYKFDEEKKFGLLGNKLRIFANTEEELNKLNIRHWLERLSDYIHISSIREVPVSRIKGYAIFSRKQVKTNSERLARHRVKRGDIDFNDALDRYQNIVTISNLPFVQLKSSGNGHPFRLFIERKDSEKMSEHKFGTYGLSSTSSVPLF